MKITSYNNGTIAHIVSDDTVISSAADGPQLLGDLYYNGFESAVIDVRNITPDFFDLKNGIAGEVLQKFSNYRMRLVIVGKLQNYESDSLHAFIGESNRTGHIGFVDTLEEALELLV